MGYARLAGLGFASNQRPPKPAGHTAASCSASPRTCFGKAVPCPASRFRRTVSLSALLPGSQASQSTSSDQAQENYGDSRVRDIFLQRSGWQAFFCIGLIAAANIVQDFDQLISEHVELSFFVPLIIGHGGNSGAQTSSAIARALALKQVCPKSAATVIQKEAYAGCMMGGALGVAVLLLTLSTDFFSAQVGLIVAVSLPVISLWANTLGAALTLSSAKLNLDPCLTSAPLVTTIVDTTGLVIYFLIAEAVISQDSLLPSLVSQNAVLAVM